MLLLSGALLLYCLTTHAQANLQPPQQLKAAMAKLDPLKGSWKGTGWLQMGSARHKFEQQENISFKANNTVLQIDGLGIDSLGNAVHQAFAVVSFNAEESNYQMLAVRADGKVIYPEIVVPEAGIIEWGFESGAGGRVKFNIEIKDGTWHETGKFSRDGENWISFLEIKLKKDSGN